MTVSIQKRSLRLSFVLVLVAAFSLTLGCAQWRPFAADVENSRGTWFNLRPKSSASGGKGTGYLRQARDIEKNLGY